ncbi:hypothetical protein [Xenorhabdus indica]|nr:hypothetical protein [Xenorhabdus indica]
MTNWNTDDYVIGMSECSQQRSNLKDKEYNILPGFVHDPLIEIKISSTNLAVNTIVSIMRDDLLGENMKYCATDNVAKYQSNKTLPTGSLDVLFFPLLNRSFKKPLN